MLIFDDSIEHEAWNQSNQERVILLFEVWRPETGRTPLAVTDPTILAVACTGAPDVTQVCLDLNDVPGLADFILARPHV